jgi:hypothetical protein
MRKYLTVIALLFISTGMMAQSHEKGTISFQANYDLGVHRTVYIRKFNGIQLGEDKSAAVTSILSVHAQYNLGRIFSAGFNYNGGAYLEDPDNAEAAGNSYRAFLFDLRLYVANKDRFNWFLSPRIGFSGLEINRRSGLVLETSKFRSNPFGLYTGFNWYPIAMFGINMQLGYMGHNFKMRSFAVNGNEINLNNFDNRLAVSGIHLQLGLSFKF